MKRVRDALRRALVRDINPVAPPSPEGDSSDETPRPSPERTRLVMLFILVAVVLFGRLVTATSERPLHDAIVFYSPTFSPSGDSIAYVKREARFITGSSLSNLMMTYEFAADSVALCVAPAPALIDPFPELRNQTGGTDSLEAERHVADSLAPSDAYVRSGRTAGAPSASRTAGPSFVDRHALLAQVPETPVGENCSEHYPLPLRKYGATDGRLEVSVVWDTLGPAFRVLTHTENTEEGGRTTAVLSNTRRVLEETDGHRHGADRAVLAIPDPAARLKLTANRILVVPADTAGEAAARRLFHQIRGVAADSGSVSAWAARQLLGHLPSDSTGHDVPAPERDR